MPEEPRAPETAELWDVDQVADHLAERTGKRPAAGTVRRTLSRWGVAAAAYAPRPTGGAPRALYPAERVRAAAAQVRKPGPRPAR